MTAEIYEDYENNENPPACDNQKDYMTLLMRVPVRHFAAESLHEFLFCQFSVALHGNGPKNGGVSKFGVVHNR